MSQPVRPTAERVEALAQLIHLGYGPFRSPHLLIRFRLAPGLSPTCDRCRDMARASAVWILDELDPSS